MRSDGQSWAIEQAAEVADASSGAFEIVETHEPENEGGDLSLIVSVNCRGFPRVEGGMPLRTRERLRLRIPWTFPLAKPEAYFTHKRYAEFSHVQWGTYICLYQSSEVEWQPGQGMFGFLERLDEWLKAGAANALDPAGFPLHPPVTYSTSSFAIVPRLNAPEVNPPLWAGLVEITSRNSAIAELGQWYSYGEAPVDGKTQLATAVLLSTTMPHEYPTTMFALIKDIVARGMPLELVHSIVCVGAMSTPVGKSALFILGAAMRGIAGEQRLQHLACWQINAEQAERLRVAYMAKTPDNPVDIEEFYSWALEAKVEWCRVFEERPEIVERRDSKSSSSWWRNKRVALLGCGAIGSPLAAILARAGVARLALYDNGIVKPGLLVRQDFSRDWVGYAKAKAVENNVKRANPDVEVSADVSNILSVMDNAEARTSMLDADVIVDATASRLVAARLEQQYRLHPETHPPIIAMVVGHNADLGMMTLARGGVSGTSYDIDRRTKLALAKAPARKVFLDEFWPASIERAKLFQPEPGCSSPTFRGSFADTLNLTSRMANVAASWLADDKNTHRTFAMDLSGGSIATGPSREIEYEWNPDLVFEEGRSGYEIRFSREAFAAMLSWIRRSERTSSSRTETGGIIFGEVDEFLKVVWIDEVSGPPPDSEAAPEGFVCGTAGVQELHDGKVRRSRGSVSFIGMWHTHPHGLPVPSSTDLGAMKQLLGHNQVFGGRRFLMLIAGGTSMMPIISAGLFQRSDYAS